MRKLTFFTLLLLLASSVGFAQSVGIAGQGFNVGLANVIEVSFTSTNSSFGLPVSFVFDNPEAIMNGLESTPQELRVRTNKAFNVNVKSKSDIFNYTGSEVPAPQKKVDDILSISLINNNTGGNAQVREKDYFNVTSNSQNLITGGGTGNNQNYSVKYKATPGSDIPEGTYAVDLIYTASQE